jgi:thiol-disulfide isomerase/thioredoxin
MDEFKTTVINDERVWLVEFYSSMCGSCKEFAPIWEHVDHTLADVMKTKINIDEKGGMEIAQYIGALDEGIPNVRLITTQDGKSASIVKGDIVPYKKIMHTTSARLSGLPRRGGAGMFLKQEMKGTPSASAPPAGAAASTGGSSELR